MPILPRTSFSPYSRISEFHLSADRRAALRTNFRRFDSPHVAARPGNSPWPSLSFHLWLPMLLLPMILIFMVLHSVARVLGSAVRWIVIWCGGFLAGGVLAWAINAIVGAGYSTAVAAAAGGFLGLVVVSAFYGMCLDWVFWVSRHENNPYAGAVSLSPEQIASRKDFAKSLQWPAALASAGGGLVFAVLLFPLIAGTQTEWPSIVRWSLLGAMALSLQGFFLGAYLGAKQKRVVYDASRHSLGELVGWQIAGTDKGLRPALGWGLGYALHQLPAGIIAGVALGGLTQLFFS